MYHDGEGVEKDMKKYMHHMEEAAIGGHPKARYNLAVNEKINMRVERTKKHFIIAANLGYDDALERVKEGFMMGFFRKEDYESALRGHQAAVDATKSEQRRMAELYDSQDPGNQN
jgi:TPR repeat protein